MDVARSILDRRIIETALALYGAHGINQLLPLLTIPYLARVLGPETWGVVMFVQAVGAYLLIAVDYSFELSATREIARHRENLESLAQTFAGVLGARIILVSSCLVLVAIAQMLSSTLHDLGWLLWIGVFWFTAMAMRPFWFFLGLERVRLVVAIEVSLKILAVGGIILLVNSPSDAWKFFALQGGASAIATIAGVAVAYRVIPFRRPSLRSAVEALRLGWHLFVFRASTSVYGMSNTLILGLLATPVAVAYYAAAERIMRMLVLALLPITQAIFPRVSTLARDDLHAAARLARIMMFTLFGLTVSGTIVIFLLAPMLVRVALGVGYGDVVPVVRILLLVIIINSISIPLGHHWLIPMGLDAFLTKVTIAGGVIHVPVAIYLGSRFAHIGMAWAFVVTELFILILLIILPLMRGLGPFRLKARSETLKVEAT